ncbi:MAG: nucleotidyl cyclase domain-containing protein [Thermoanaerobaculia bacterium]
MADNLVRFLLDRPETATFLLPQAIAGTLSETFDRPDWLLPRPYKIFFADENVAPVLGFPLLDAPVLHELETKLDRWIAEETGSQIDGRSSKEKAQQAFSAYITQVVRVAENALLSNLMSDYHAVFWLTHSLEVSRHFANIPRRMGSIDPLIARTQGDATKYRLFTKWASELRDQMSRMTARLAPVLDGEEERGMQFFRVLQENVLIFTEEIIGPDLRELRSFMVGYLHRDASSFRDVFERVRNFTVETIKRDRVFRSGVALFGVSPDQGAPLALLLDRRFQRFVFEHPSIDLVVNREEREQFLSMSRRICEFAILHLLRRGLTFMTTTPGGDVLQPDGRGTAFSRSTRPIDFGRPGVVDPMVFRFGLIYDISAFSETLGDIARSGRKGELNSYRQMLVFQRRLESITARHRLQFEKFLGDGAFYTTRRALRLVRAAIEIQRFYSDFRKRGFAFSKGIRIALNYGYYRLLPMKGSSETNERVTEFYGPGVVELSRLTTGKANREIAEIQSFLLGHGYDEESVRTFFAPLARGVDLIDHEMHKREFYAYSNASGHLINEGIVASLPLLQELSNELVAESQQIYRIESPWGTYFAFNPEVEGIGYIGIRLIGTVALKGLGKVEVGEIVDFDANVLAVEVEITDSLVTLLRQEYHEEPRPAATSADDAGTGEHELDRALILCASPGFSAESEVLVGEWDPISDQVYNAVRIPRWDFQQLIGVAAITPESIDGQRKQLYEFYRKVDKLKSPVPIPLTSFRVDETYVALVIGTKIEQL